MNLDYPKSLFIRALRLVNWPLLLIGPAAMAAVYALRAAGLKSALDKPLHETLALILLPIALALVAARAAVTRRPLFLILACLTALLLCREIHFDGSDNLLYGSLPLIVIWLWLWRARLEPDWQDRRFTCLFFAAMFLYFLSQVVARRVFRGILPNEKKMHIPLEEFIETTAHVMLVLAYALPSWAKRGSTDSSEHVAKDLPTTDDRLPITDDRLPITDD